MEKGTSTSGSVDLKMWQTLTSGVADLNKWSGTDKLRLLKVRLNSKAYVAYGRLPHVTKQSYSTTREVLYSRFEPEFKHEL